MTEHPLDPLAQEATISTRLKDAGYVMSKLNLVTWQVLDLHTGLTYALTLRDNAYHCLPLLGNELAAAMIQQIVRDASQQTSTQNPELPDEAADLEGVLGKSKAATGRSDTAMPPIEEQVEPREDEEAEALTEVVEDSRIL